MKGVIYLNQNKNKKSSQNEPQKKEKELNKIKEEENIDLTTTKQSSFSNTEPKARTTQDETVNLASESEKEEENEAEDVQAAENKIKVEQKKKKQEKKDIKEEEDNNNNNDDDNADDDKKVEGLESKPLPPKEPIERKRDSENLPKTTKQKSVYKKEDKNETFTETMAEYIQNYKFALKQKDHPTEETIHVDEIASKVAKAYEKLRRVIDWKEEHLVRRTAIERILKRRLISEISEITILPDLNAKEMARPITLEIIRTGYFENGKIPESKIDDIADVLEKYIFILKHSPYAKESALAIKTKVQFYNWILEIAACEIEEILDYPYKENYLIEFMTEAMYKRIKLIPPDQISEEDKYIQVYIAVHKSLYNLDDPVINYHVLIKRYPLFKENNKEFLQEFISNIKNIWRNLNNDLEHPKGNEFNRICEKYDAAYFILADAMKKLEQENGDRLENSLKDEDKLAGLVEEAYNERLSTLKKRLFRSAFYSTLSIFVAGSASLIIFELPIAKLFYGRFSPWAMFADIMIPTALMFFLVTLIKPPPEDNLDKVQEEIKKIVYENGTEQTYTIKLNKKIKKVQNLIFSIIYLLGGAASMYFIYWIFKVAGVPLTSLYIDTANVALVVFAAMAIRQKAREISIKERTSFLEFLLDFFSIPLAKLGGWFASKWKEFNFISVFFSTLVDTPFSTFIEFLEGWRDYIKEKRAGL